LPLDVNFPVAKYALLMSSVPGLPLDITTMDGVQVQVTVDQGELLRWGPETDSKVISEGHAATFTGSATIYWSPMSGDPAVSEGQWPANARITVTATANGKTASTMIVDVTSEGIYYSAAIVK
jgi:hypothetical protein